MANKEKRAQEKAQEEDIDEETQLFSHSGIP